jgi:integrase
MPKDRILLELEMTEALRPSELFALRWKCFDPDKYSIDLQETVYRGKIRNHGKTKKSLGKIHITQYMVSDLQVWKIVCPDSSPEAFIFPNRNGGVRDSNNFRNRVLGQLRENLNLPKLTFQVIRRTMATLSQTKGTVKDTQGLLRHGHLTTTTDVYMQVIPEGVKQMINSMHDELRNGR